MCSMDEASWDREISVAQRKRDEVRKGKSWRNEVRKFQKDYGNRIFLHVLEEVLEEITKKMKHCWVVS